MLIIGVGSIRTLMGIPDKDGLARKDVDAVVPF